MEEDDDILELAISVQAAGKERGRRIYFDSKDIEEVRDKFGDDFFLLTDRKLLAFVDATEKKITITPIKGIYKKHF